MVSELWPAEVEPMNQAVDDEQQQEDLESFVARAFTGDTVVINEIADQYPTVRFKIGGAAAPQGSKTGFIARKKGAPVTEGKVVLRESSKRNPQWRTDVAKAATDAMEGHLLLLGPLLLDVTFVFPRPASHRTSKGALTKAAALIGAPIGHNIGDCSKLVRSIEDAMNKIVYLDDSQISTIAAKKRWGIAAATYITVRPDPVDG